jgi:hypothetical protein
VSRSTSLARRVYAGESQAAKSSETRARSGVCGGEDTAAGSIVRVAGSQIEPVRPGR